MSEYELWKRDGETLGWEMPSAVWWKRLPVIRHVRAIYGSVCVELWYSRGPGFLGIRTGYDEWVLWGIWHGYEKKRV